MENETNEKYDFKQLRDYFIKNKGNDGKDIKIEWISDTKYNIDLKIIDYDKVIWEYSNKLMTQLELSGLVQEIEKILKNEYNIVYPVKMITTVTNVMDKSKQNNVIKLCEQKKQKFDKIIADNKLLRKEKTEITKKDKKEEYRIHNAKRKINANIYATVSKDNHVYLGEENMISFSEIMGFRVYNKEKNIAICLDFWKVDEKIVLRLEDKLTGKVSKILFQKSIKEILEEINMDKIESEKTSGFN